MRLFDIIYYGNCIPPPSASVHTYVNHSIVLNWRLKYTNAECKNRRGEQCNPLTISRAIQLVVVADSECFRNVRVRSLLHLDVTRGRSCRWSVAIAVVVRTSCHIWHRWLRLRSIRLYFESENISLNWQIHYWLIHKLTQTFCIPQRRTKCCI